MGTFIDLTGRKFNRLLVLERVNKRGNEWQWRCLCDCGNVCIVEGRNLRGNKTKSCGCLKIESDRSPKGNVIDEIGHVYGHLSVIERDGSLTRGQATWWCKCDCGNPNLISVTGDNLRRGHTTSCGCDRRSNGEKKIIDILIANQIPFITEYKFNNFNNYRFDFYVNNSYLIEYDGETHYRYNLHGWHDEAQLKAQQQRDKEKNQYCLDNNIPLIRIPYHRYNKLCINDLKLETTTFLIKN